MIKQSTPNFIETFVPKKSRIQNGPAVITYNGYDTQNIPLLHFTNTLILYGLLIAPNQQERDFLKCHNFSAFLDCKRVTLRRPGRRDIFELT